MPITLARESREIEMPDPHFWVESGREGHYQDMASDEETAVLGELRREPWRETVRRRYAATRPWLFRIITDERRSAFVKLLPLRMGARCLDVGSGWGQIAFPLSRTSEVCCLDLTTARIAILREVARQEGVVLDYVCGNFRSFPFGEHQFDAVIFNGSLEYMATEADRGSIWEVHVSVLAKARSLLSKDGFIYVGIENALGLKYILGAPDDHTGAEHASYLSEAESESLRAGSIPGSAVRVKTWTLPEYRALFAAAGLGIDSAYACFPDYKLIDMMVPLTEINSALPDRIRGIREHSGVDGTILPQNDRLPALYHALARSGIAEYFCPSYAFIVRAL